MNYNDFKFLYPPRAEVKTRPSLVNVYDTEEYVGQPKYNGSCCNVFLHKSMVEITNRHGEKKTRVANTIDFESIITDDTWTVLSGELMDKSKKGEDGLPIIGFIIWDILVYKSEYLVGATLQDRLSLLEMLWPCHRMVISGDKLVTYKHLCHTGINGIYKTPTYIGGNNYFPKLYNELIQTDAYEGLVIKKLNGKLELGFNEKNNSGWQLKARKPTKNAKF